MSCSYVDENIKEYFQQKLSAEDAAAFEEHLVSCENCSAQVESYKQYFSLLKRSEPGFDLPDGILKELSDELIKLSSANGKEKTLEPDRNNKAGKSTNGEKKEEKKEEKKVRDYSFVKPLLIILVILALVAAGVLFFLNYGFSNAPWSVKPVKGSYTIDGLVNSVNKVEESENILTDLNSEILLLIPQSGRITIKENTLVTIEKAIENDNIISVKQGGISVNTNSRVPQLKIVTPSVTIIDERGEYDISILSDKTEIYTVKEGLMEIDLHGKITPIGSGYICELKEGSVLGVPYRNDAAPLLKEELNKYLFESGGIESLQIVLSEAVEEDAITLWNLINRVDRNELLLLFDKLNEIYPVPEGVTKKRVLGLSKEVLDLWWNEIEWQL